MPRVNTVDEYIDQFEGEQRAWLAEFVGFMRREYPEIPEVLSYQIPMYKALTHSQQRILSKS